MLQVLEGEQVTPGGDEDLQSEDEMKPDSASDFSKHVGKEVNDEGVSVIEIMASHMAVKVNNRDSRIYIMESTEIGPGLSPAVLPGMKDLLLQDAGASVYTPPDYPS